MKVEDEQKERAEALRNVKFYQTKPITPGELIEKIKGGGYDNALGDAIPESRRYELE